MVEDHYSIARTGRWEDGPAGGDCRSGVQVIQPALPGLCGFRRNADGIHHAGTDADGYVESIFPNARQKGGHTIQALFR